MGELIQIPPTAPALDRERAGRSDVPLRTDGIYVVFTSIEGTLAAVKVAHCLATAMGASLTIVHFWTVPPQLPVEAPPGISPAQSEGFLASLRAERVDAEVRICLCRSDQRAMEQAFKPSSLVVLAGQRHWWPSPFERRLRAIEAAGHHVLCVNTCKAGERAPHEVDDPTGRPRRREPGPQRIYAHPQQDREPVTIEKGVTRA